MVYWKAAAGLLLTLGAASRVAAWDATVTGQIAVLELPESKENFGFRIYLKSGAALCSSGHAWAYVDGNASNYQAIIATLTSAWMADRTVTLHTLKDGQGYCRIGHMSVR